jgi:hypothetical protein
LRQTIFCLFAVSLASAGLHAQTSPLIAEMKAAYTTVKTNLLKAADKIPEADYNWKPADSVRTIGAIFGHVANQARTCAAVSGDQVTVDTSKTAKADVVAALKASFDACDKAWDGMNEKTAFDTIAGRGGQLRTKLGSLVLTTVGHDNEQYGYLSVYMRLKDIVPPSSDRGQL